MNRNFFISISFLFVLALGACRPGENPETRVADPRVVPTAAGFTEATPAPSNAPDGQTDSGATRKNLLAFGAGALVVSATSESKAAGEAARNLIDEAESGGWVSAEGQAENQAIVLELPARTTLKTIVFDTSEIDFGKRAARDIVIEVSDESPENGFQTILEATLADQRRGQAFPVTREFAGRFVRVTAKSSHGSAKQIALEEIRGYGVQEEAPSLVAENLSGTYQTEFYEEIHLRQEGTSIVGCYKYEEGVLTGGVEGRTLTLNWTQRGGAKGFAVINFAADGRRFLSAWWSGAKKSYDAAWKGEKKSDKIGGCAHLPGLGGDSGGAAQNELAKNLEQTGRAVLYGINFDFNSDSIRAESRRTLEQVAALLKERSDWKIGIEGHTDNVGGAAFNRTLSEKRAAAVLKFLTGAGIDASRLSSAGAGLSKPVASNETEAGRAQNRRVELIKQ